jgi:hypothetical protein
MAFELDPRLEKYATESQWLKLTTVEKYGSEVKAAEILGIHRRAIYTAKKSVLNKAIQQGYSPEHNMVHTIPDGYRLRGASTLYNATGEPIMQWVKSERDAQRQHDIFMEVVQALTESLPRAEPVPAPDICEVDLLACYPVGDHHLGMLAWDKETGADYDMKISESLLQKAADHLVDIMPAAETALVAFLGDFLHYDSFEAVTPTSRNQLDSDTRYPKMVRAGIRCMRYLIDKALTKHQTVHVIVEIGNHDLSSSIFLMECLNCVYENEPRVLIDTSPMHYHYFRFGNVLIGTHHGHGTPMKNLPLIMATDRPHDWGETEYRHWWTGHIHRIKTQAATSAEDYSGCTVESFRVLAAPDAWAHQKGYRPHRDMKSILFHRKYGEVSRSTVNPSMFESVS